MSVVASKAQMVEAGLTGVSILEIGLAGIEGGIDDWHEVLVEVQGAIVHALVLRRAVIVIRTHNGIGAIASALEPGLYKGERRKGALKAPYILKVASGDERRGVRIYKRERRKVALKAPYILKDALEVERRRGCGFE